MVRFDAIAGEDLIVCSEKGAVWRIGRVLCSRNHLEEELDIWDECEPRAQPDLAALNRSYLRC